MCDFHEPYFGADYPDACCIDGFLWDLDSCDVPGGPLTSGGDVSCPRCCHTEWLAQFEDDLIMRGYEAFEGGLPREYKHRAVREEQPGDADTMRAWWYDGYDQAVAEAAQGVAP